MVVEPELWTRFIKQISLISPSQSSRYKETTEVNKGINHFIRLKLVIKSNIDVFNGDILLNDFPPIPRGFDGDWFTQRVILVKCYAFDIYMSNYNIAMCEVNWQEAVSHDHG